MRQDTVPVLRLYWAYAEPMLGCVGFYVLPVTVDVCWAMLSLKIEPY